MAILQRNTARIKSTQYDIWREKYHASLYRSKEEFIAHFEDKYGKNLPIWVSVEIWDFGLLSIF